MDKTTDLVSSAESVGSGQNLAINWNRTQPSWKPRAMGVVIMTVGAR